MKLNYKKYGQGQPFIILHGLFGSSDNWHTHGKKLAEYFEVYLVDQRNHGDSEWSADFSYDIMADDLYELVQDLQLKDIILMGHSMGGKTAMRYAQKYRDTLAKLIVVDMGIKSYPITHNKILEGLLAIELDHLKSRSEANKILANYEEDVTVRQFLLKNLKRTKDDHFKWKINIKILNKKLPEIVGNLPHQEVLVETLFISGGLSPYVKPEDKDDLLQVFPLAEFYTIQNVGHWIHAEAPDEFLKQVLEFSLL